jgi:hypothetical protein
MRKVGNQRAEEKHDQKVRKVEKRMAMKRMKKVGKRNKAERGNEKR